MIARILIALWIGIVGACCVQAADQRDIQNVLGKYRSIHPKAADLCIYDLDWMPTLKAAKEKAAKEGRPVFLVVVTNSFGNVCSGHC